MKTVCFTGHRDLSREEREDLYPKLLREIEKAAERGADTFRCGGARGVDTLAALAVLEYKKEYSFTIGSVRAKRNIQTFVWSFF